MNAYHSFIRIQGILVRQHVKYHGVISYKCRRTPVGCGGGQIQLKQCHYSWQNILESSNNVCIIKLTKYLT